MKTHRAWQAMVLIPVLTLGVALGASRPAAANDLGTFVGGLVAGALLDQVFDRDYPRGAGFIGDPVWYFYPRTGVYCFPDWAKPYPYGRRCWIAQEDYRGRMVFVPVEGGVFGPMEIVRFRSGVGGPIFLGPTYLTRLGARYDIGRDPYDRGRWSFPALLPPLRPGWDRDDQPPWRTWNSVPDRDRKPSPYYGRTPDRDRKPDPGSARPWGGAGDRDHRPNPGSVQTPGGAGDRDQKPNPGSVQTPGGAGDRNHKPNPGSVQTPGGAGDRDHKPNPGSVQTPGGAGDPGHSPGGAHPVDRSHPPTPAPAPRPNGRPGTNGSHRESSRGERDD